MIMKRICIVILFWFVWEGWIYNRVPPRGGAQTGICNGVQEELGDNWLHTTGPHLPECWQLWPIVGGAGNGAVEEDWRWDLNPGTAAIWHLFLGPRSFGRVRTTWLWKCSLFATWMVLGAWITRTSTSFLRFGIPDWPEGEGRTVCVCGYSKEL